MRNSCPGAGYPSPYPAPYPAPYPSPYPAPGYPVPGSAPGFPSTPAMGRPYNPRPPYGGGGVMSALANIMGDIGLGVAREMNQLPLVGGGQNALGCGKWKTEDGLTEHKMCCTPSVGRFGVKVAACIKISRPVDPWSQQSTPGLDDAPPSWPVPM